MTFTHEFLLLIGIAIITLYAMPYVAAGAVLLAQWLMGAS